MYVCKCLDFPDIFRYFSWEILVGKKEKKLDATLYIFTRLFTRQDGLQNRNYRNYSI